MGTLYAYICKMISALMHKQMWEDGRKNEREKEGERERKREEGGERVRERESAREQERVREARARTGQRRALTRFMYLKEKWPCQGFYGKA